MTCNEAKLILDSFQLTNNDKIYALDCIKRYIMEKLFFLILYCYRTLIDHQSTEGIEYILSAFPFTNDKLKAMSILASVKFYLSHI